MMTAHGPFPVYSEPTLITQQLIHFGEPIKMSTPLITVAAKMLYFSRREIVPFNIPPHLPVNREHAMQLGHFEVGPTQDDVVEFNAHINTKLPPATRWNWWEDLTAEELSLGFSGVWTPKLKLPSAKWDNDWMRLNYCYNPWIDIPAKGTVYTPGMLTGLWQGRMIVGLPHFFSAVTRDLRCLLRSQMSSLTSISRRHRITLSRSRKIIHASQRCQYTCVFVNITALVHNIPSIRAGASMVSTMGCRMPISPMCRWIKPRCVLSSPPSAHIVLTPL
jgi:hypothetical protein